ncbi:MAG TPA: hypothetical protein VF763_10275 [Candidatus Limnocylindrales bacterium]
MAAPASPSPAAFHLGRAHRIVHANPAFVAAYGPACLGQPAREAMLDLPAGAFELMDLVYREGRHLAARIRTERGERRLVVVARRDPETGETYGVATHLVPVGSMAQGR